MSGNSETGKPKRGNIPGAWYKAGNFIGTWEQGIYQFAPREFNSHGNWNLNRKKNIDLAIEQNQMHGYLLGLFVRKM